MASGFFALSRVCGVRFVFLSCVRRQALLFSTRVWRQAFCFSFVCGVLLCFSLRCGVRQCFSLQCGVRLCFSLQCGVRLCFSLQCGVKLCFSLQCGVRLSSMTSGFVSRIWRQALFLEYGVGVFVLEYGVRLVVRVWRPFLILRIWRPVVLLSSMAPAFFFMFECGTRLFVFFECDTRFIPSLNAAPVSLDFCLVVD